MTPAAKCEIRRNRVLGKVKKAYRVKKKLRTTDDSRFYGVPLETRLKASTPNLEAWICHLHVAERSYEKFGERREDNSKKQTTISAWVKGNIRSGSPVTSR